MQHRPIFALLLLWGLSLIAGNSPAATVDSVTVTDNVYGPFFGSIATGATGNAAKLNWHSAVYFTPFSIDFTNGAGQITDQLFSNVGGSGDLLEFDGFLSGNSVIGATCAAGATTACLMATGQTQDLTSIVAGLIGRSICCGTSTIAVIVGDGLTSNIDQSGASFLASNLGSSVNPSFQGGTLVMNQPGGSYSQNFTLNNSGTNTIDQSGNTSTFTGSFSNAAPGVPGAITIVNSGTGGAVIFAGINSYSGITTINFGATLALSDSGSIATSSGLIDNGTFDISSSHGTTISTLSGAGAVNLGANVLTLAAASDIFAGTISGSTGSGLIIADGTEHLNGAVTASTLMVNARATLRGVGTINAATTVAGTIAPGNSPGTLLLTGPLTLRAGSMTEIDIDGTGTGTGAGNYSRVIISGSGSLVTLGGVLEPLLRGISPPASNTYIPQLSQSFQIIAAQGGITGSFSSLTQPVGLRAGTRMDAIYAPQVLSVVVTPAAYGNLGLAGLSETASEAVIGRALDAIRPAAGPRMDPALANLFYPLYSLPGAAIPGALEQLSPTIYGEELLATREAWYEMADLLADHMAARRSGIVPAQTEAGPHGSTIWISGVGQFTDVKSASTPGFHSSTGGVMAGIDVAVAPGAFAGVAVGGTSIQTVSDGAIASGSAVQFAVYGGLQAGIFFVDGQGAFMHSDQNVRRPIGFVGLSSMSDGGVNGGGIDVHGGIRLGYDHLQIEPTLGLSVMSISSPAIGETTGGVLAEGIAADAITSVRSLAAIRASTVLALTPTIPLQVHGLVGWQHEYADTIARSTGSFLGIAAFTIPTAPIARDAARLAAGIDMILSPCLSVFGSYQVAIGNGSTSQYLTGGLRLIW